jgi:hypothetical protein
MKACPNCGAYPVVEQLGKRRFIAKCPSCGSHAAYWGMRVFPAVMKIRKAALKVWDKGLIVQPTRKVDA